MSRTMYDACTPANVPADAAMVAYYLYGNCKWPAADIARFPKARHVRIATVASLNDGHVLDVEAGDAAPDLAPQWCQRRRAAGQDPTVYCNVDTWPVVIAAFHSHGVPLPHFWIAHYDGLAILPPGAVAKQYRNSVAPGYDVSIVADYWPGVDPAQPTTQGDGDLTGEEHNMLAAVYAALFEPVPTNGGFGAATPNNLDIVRRVVSPYAKGYPPANPPAAPTPVLPEPLSTPAIPENA